MHRTNRLYSLGLFDSSLALMDGHVALPVQSFSRGRDVSRSIGKPELHIEATSAARRLDSEPRREHGLAVPAAIEVRLRGTRVRLRRRLLRTRKASRYAVSGVGPPPMARRC